ESTMRRRAPARVAVALALAAAASLSITDDGNVITRPVMTLVNSVPHPDPHDVPLDIVRTTGFGESVSQMNLQPFASYFLPGGRSVGYSGNILANWEAGSDDTWTVPIGVEVAKVLRLGKLPVRIGLTGQYMPVRPDAFGQKWDLQVVVAPVLP